MKQDISLREIRNMLGLSRRIIQGYEKEGLIRSTSRNKYGHLLYDEETLRRIVRIRFYQETGFQLKEIAAFMDGPADAIKMRLKERKENLEKQRKRLDRQIEIIDDYLNEGNDTKYEEAIMEVIREERK